jgi:hypothetical protein
MYIQYIQDLFQSRLRTADHALVTSSFKSQSQSYIRTDSQSASQTYIDASNPVFEVMQEVNTKQRQIHIIKE